MYDEKLSLVKLKKIERFLKIASDETRLKILFSLIDEHKCACAPEESRCCSKCSNLSCMIEKCVNDISIESCASQSLISHQLKVLKNNDFVKTRREKNRIFYSLKDGHIKELINISKEHVEEK